MRTSKNVRIFLTVCGIALLGGCTQPPDPVESQPGLNEGHLPKVVSDGNCLPETPPELCTWFAAVDAVVVADITKISADYSFLVEGINGGAVVDERGCNGLAEPTMRISLQIVETISGQVPEVLDVWIGGFQFSDWQPTPNIENRDWKWGYSGGERGLAVGQRVGFVLYHDPNHDVWTPFGQPLFSLKDDARIGWQEADQECSPLIPTSFAGASLESIKAQASACSPSPTNVASLRAALTGGDITQHPEHYAGRCIMQEVPTTGCQSDSECPAGKLCSSGSCVE